MFSHVSGSGGQEVEEEAMVKTSKDHCRVGRNDQEEAATPGSVTGGPE